MRVKEEILVTAIIILMISLSLGPNLYSFLNRHRLSPQREWLYIHNYLYDFNSYLSKMKQGELGRWTVVEKYTSEPHQGSFYQILYLMLGKIGHFFGLSVEASHLLWRVILGAAWLLVVYLFISFFFKDKFLRVASFLVSLLSAGFPRQLPWKLTTWYDWWSEFNVFARPTFLPHFLVGHFCLALSLLFFFLSFQEKKPQKALKKILTSGLWALLSGIVLPPSLLAIYGALAFFLLGLLLTRKTTDLFRALKTALAVFLISLPSVFYFLTLFSKYPWKEIADWEKTSPFWVDMRMYAYSQGTTFFIALLAATLVFLRVILRKKEKAIFLLPAGWFLTHLLGTWFLNRTRLYLPMRFWQVASFVPAGILTVWLINALVRFFKKERLKIVFLMLLFLSFLPGICLNWRYLIDREESLLSYNIMSVPYPHQEHYPLKTVMEAIRWLADNTKPEEVVLSHLTVGNFIPAYAGNTVYIGNTTQTVRIEDKFQSATDFFSGKFAQTQAKDFLRKNKINYVFWGPQERYWGGSLSQYPFLEKTYENKDVAIFTFTP